MSVKVGHLIEDPIGASRHQLRPPITGGTVASADETVIKSYVQPLSKCPI
jgi:hypothetical protein